MTQTFQPGELVNVQLKGVRYVRHEPDGALTIQTNDPDEHLWALPPQAAVERVAPKEWPPQAGDVWADGDNAEWFAFAPRHQDGITLRPAVDMAFWAAPADLLAKHGPMRLVRRRGWTPDEPAVELAKPDADQPCSASEMFAHVAELVAAGLPCPMSLFLFEHDSGSRSLQIRLPDDAAADVVRWAARIDGPAPASGPLFEGGRRQPWRSYKSEGFRYQSWRTEVWSAVSEPVDCCPDAAEEPPGPAPLVDAEQAEAAGETVEDAEVTP